MPSVPRAAVDELTRQINLIDKAAQDKIARVLERVDWSDVTAARKVVSDALQMVCGASATLAAEAAAEFFDAARIYATGEALGAEALPDYNPDATDGAVRGIVDGVVKGKPAQVVNEKLLQRVSYEVNRAANMSMANNAERDPLKPRYARVPTGGETCGFCLMLASRGFVYKDADLASHAHANCDCRVVSSWEKGGAIEGYSPGYYRELYAAYTKTKALDMPEKTKTAIIDANRWALQQRYSVEAISPAVFADSLDDGAAAAFKAFKKEGKTAKSYGTHVGKYLEEIGNVLDVKLSAKPKESDNGRLIFPNPNGEEIFASIAAARKYGAVFFEASDRDIWPDIVIGGDTVGEIKTIRKADKTKARVAHAIEQVEAAADFPNKKVFVSLLRAGDNGEEIVSLLGEMAVPENIRLVVIGDDMEIMEI